MKNKLKTSSKNMENYERVIEHMTYTQIIKVDENNRIFINTKYRIRDFIFDYISNKKPYASEYYDENSDGEWCELLDRNELITLIKHIYTDYLYSLMEI